MYGEMWILTVVMMTIMFDGRADAYTNQWAAHIVGGPDAAQQVAREHGFHTAYKVTRPLNFPYGRLDTARLLSSEIKPSIDDRNAESNRRTPLKTAVNDIGFIVVFPIGRRAPPTLSRLKPKITTLELPHQIRSSPFKPSRSKNPNAQSPGNNLNPISINFRRFAIFLNPFNREIRRGTNNEETKHFDWTHSTGNCRTMDDGGHKKEETESERSIDRRPLIDERKKRAAEVGELRRLLIDSCPQEEARPCRAEAIPGIRNGPENSEWPGDPSEFRRTMARPHPLLETRMQDKSIEESERKPREPLRPPPPECKQSTTSLVARTLESTPPRWSSVTALNAKSTRNKLGEPFGRLSTLGGNSPHKEDRLTTDTPGISGHNSTYGAKKYGSHLSTPKMLECWTATIRRSFTDESSNSSGMESRCNEVGTLMKLTPRWSSVAVLNAKSTRNKLGEPFGRLSTLENSPHKEDRLTTDTPEISRHNSTYGAKKYGSHLSTSKMLECWTATVRRSFTNESSNSSSMESRCNEVGTLMKLTPLWSSVTALNAKSTRNKLGEPFGRLSTLGGNSPHKEDRMTTDTPGVARHNSTCGAKKYGSHLSCTFKKLDCWTPTIGRAFTNDSSNSSGMESRCNEVDTLTKLTEGSRKVVSVTKPTVCITTSSPLTLGGNTPHKEVRLTTDTPGISRHNSTYGAKKYGNHLSFTFKKLNCCTPTIRRSFTNESSNSSGMDSRYNEVDTLPKLTEGSRKVVSVTKPTICITTSTPAEEIILPKTKGSPGQASDSSPPTLNPTGSCCLPMLNSVDSVSIADLGDRSPNVSALKYRLSKCPCINGMWGGCQKTPAVPPDPLPKPKRPLRSSFKKLCGPSLAAKSASPVSGDWRKQRYHIRQRIYKCAQGEKSSSIRDGGLNPCPPLIEDSVRCFESCEPGRTVSRSSAFGGQRCTGKPEKPRDTKNYQIKMQESKEQARKIANGQKRCRKMNRGYY